MIGKLFKVLVFSFVGLFLAGGVFANSGLSLELVGQTPDPVKPGNFVYVSVKVSNYGSDAVSGARLSFDESRNFVLAEGEGNEENLGVIAAKNSVTKKYKILVGKGAPLGYNSLHFKVQSNVLVEDDLDILVGSSDNALVVKDVVSSEVSPGGDASLKFVLGNLKSNVLRDLAVELDLSSVDDKVFSLKSGSNRKIVGDLLSGGEVFVDFGLVVSPMADSKPYLIPVTVSYEDDLGTEFSKDLLASIKVFSEPILSLSLDSQEKYSVGKSQFTFALANPSSSSIKGTLVEVLPGEGYKVLTGNVQYVGDLNPDDFQTIQSDVYVESNSVESLNLKIKYLNSYNVESEKVLSVPIVMYSEEELESFGLSKGKSGPSTVVIYLVSLVLIVGAFFFGKRRARCTEIKLNKVSAPVKKK